ncbi:CP15 60 sporozoite 60K [Cryptosporidium bovis]|uniref:CP15 60 sporozoite 60K n=1 Tax=Cryptosporidium bovis TaxID=310047 RepID=UPI00351A6C3B|nr:CP15 60 sporozoite 60K [Cryptosporidium bovis]
MGNFRSCCSFTDEHSLTSTQLVVGNGSGISETNSNHGNDVGEVNTFNVKLIMQDRSKLDCEVVFDSTSISLSGDGKCRNIGIDEIHQLLYSKEELSRVESSAGISDSDNCVAIHLKESGNCIPLFFKNQQDKERFIATASKYRPNEN